MSRQNNTSSDSSVTEIYSLSYEAPEYEFVLNSEAQKLANGHYREKREWDKKDVEAFIKENDVDWSLGQGFFRRDLGRTLRDIFPDERTISVCGAKRALNEIIANTIRAEQQPTVEVPSLATNRPYGGLETLSK